MNFQYYKNYIVIVEEGSLTSASRKLSVAQPALSNQVKSLEEAYGARLFHRGSGSHRLELTDAGRVLYEKAKTMVHAESCARNEILNCFDGFRGSLRLGITASLENRYLMRVLAAFSERYPETEILLHEARTPELIRMLQSGIVEAILVRSSNQRFDNLEVIFERKDSLVVTYKKGCFFSNNAKESLPLSALADLPLCVTEGQIPMLKNAFRAANTVFTPKFIGSSTNACLMWARAGKGIALISRLTRTLLDYEDMPFKSITDKTLTADTLSIVTQREQYRSRVVNNFLEIVAELYGNELKCLRPLDYIKPNQ